MTCKPAQPDPGDEMLDAKEAARMYGVHPSTFKRWLNAGQIAGGIHTPGNHWRIPRRALRAAQEASTEPATNTSDPYAAQRARRGEGSRGGRPKGSKNKPRDQR